MTLTLDEVYNALYTKEKMKQLVVGSKAQEEGLVIQGGCKKGILVVMQKVDRSLKIKRKLVTTAKKKGHIKSECYKLQNKNKKAVVNQKGKQLDNFGEASAAENDCSDGELLVISDGGSKPCEDWIFDSICRFHMCPNWD